MMYLKHPFRNFVPLLTIVLSCVLFSVKGQSYHFSDSSKSDTTFINQIKTLIETGNIRSVKTYAVEKHYLAFSIDSITYNNQQTNYYINIGKSTSKKIFFEPLHKTIEINDYPIFLNQLLSNFEDKGYPFCSIKIVPIRENQDTLIASLDIIKGTKFYLDSIHFDKEVISEKYLYRLLDLKKGENYNESKIQNIAKVLSKSNVIRLMSNPTLTFYQNKCIIHLNLRKKGNNQFNGYIGLLPKTNANITTYSLTGNIQLRLLNSFKRAEEIGLFWNQFEPLSQDLKINYKHPYIGGSNYGFNHQFSLFKKDSSFVNLNTILGMDVFFSTSNKLTFFYQKKSTISNQTLSNINNTSTSAYGITASFDYTNQALAPLKGWLLNISGTVGKRTLQSLEDWKEISLMNENNLTSTVLVPKTSNIYSADFIFEKYTSLNFHVLLNSLKASTTINPFLFQNELEWVGGLKNFRGFNDRSLLASSYAINTLEYRFHLDRFSYIHLFHDLGWIQNNLIGVYDQNFTSAYGAGLNFSSKAGIISFTYALGHFLDDPILLKDGKVHIGYVSLF